MEIRHRLRMKRHLPSRAVAGLDAYRVFNEIEVDLERPFAIRYGRGGQPARGHVERDVPRMIKPGCLRQADLAYDLRPQMKCRAGLPPGQIRQVRPCSPICTALRHAILRSRRSDKR